ncbi:MAG: methyltransferase domain-containing protein [Deferribacterales bacterium]
MSKDRMVNDWNTFYKRGQEANTNLSHPSETIIRMLKGDYIDGTIPQIEGKSILDVGCGIGNNTVFLNTLGMKVSGTEISEDICASVREKLEGLGLGTDIRVGKNTELPYDDNTFDYLLSWNVLHYEGNEAGVIKGIQEYMRVLKPGGRLLLSTTGPDHKIKSDCKLLGNHLFQIGRDKDIRKGQVHFFFDTKEYIRFYFEEYFRELQIGRIYDDLFGEVLDWFIVTGVK